MEFCGAVSPQRERCNLPAGHAERGVRMHSISMEDGSYTHRWCCEDEISLPVA